MKGRLRNVSITKEQRKFANLEISDLENLNLLKNNYDKFVLEFCCGTGDFLVNYAQIEVKTFFIGVDYAENAILRALKKAYNKKLYNCKFINAYIQEAINYFKDDFFDIIYINFPDPWPKRRHASRRLVTKDFLCKVNKILKKEGICIIITDNKWYQDFIDQQLKEIKCYSKYYNDAWYIEDEEKFCSTFAFFSSNYYLKAKKMNNKIRFYVLKKLI
ncbi:MAG TPA: methyltransferase domain-containing protein [Exilispira sp.]|nr:methyltransferase domain-containing protein [Exilispira sp.]